jgi:sigma-B regulation protein RsbU (phosphoserine phosphatase)
MLGKGYDTEPLRHMGPALGLIEGIDYPTATRELQPKDTMLLLTDGVSEAFDVSGSLFGQDRLTVVLTGRGSNDPHAIIKAVTEEVARFSVGAEQPDDITALAVQFRGPSLST